jgi:hypothetical protein
MSKRITTAVDAIDAINDIAVGDLELKARNLARIPDPVFTSNIPWEKTYSDRAFNVRDEESYTFEENETLYRSLMDRGLETRGSDNMSFSLQSDGRYLVIGGNLRWAMMDLGRKETARIATESNRPIDDSNPLPFATIFGIVFSGLTREQETDLMADHTMKKGLNEFELCKEIGEACHRLKLTDEKAAIKYGLKKSSIARLRMRYNMPTVLKEYRKEKDRKNTLPYVKVGQKMLTHLYTCYYSDQQAGCSFRQEGVNFRLAWDEYLRNPESAGPMTAKPKSQDRDTIVSQLKSLSGAFGNNPEIVAVRDILAWAGQEDTDGKIPSLQAAVMALKDLCEGLRADRDRLATDLESARSALADLQTSFDGLTVELSDVKSERDALKAKNVKAKV